MLNKCPAASHNLQRCTNVFTRVQKGENDKIKIDETVKTGSEYFGEMAKIDWSCILSSLDVNYCVSEFTRLFNAAVDAVAPFREVRVRSNPNPWMNSSILAGIKKRDSLLSRFKKDKTNVLI